jgi:hypothetical protein
MIRSFRDELKNISSLLQGIYCLIIYSVGVYMWIGIDRALKCKLNLFQIQSIEFIGIFDTSPTTRQKIYTPAAIVLINLAYES